MIVARRVATTLAALGIRRAYGLPGEDHMTLLDALASAGVEYHTAVNESSAVIMAAADAQVTGVPGLAVLSLAPGISNGTNGLLHTYMEGLPVLVISGQHASHRAPFVVRQGFDLNQLTGPMTKWSGRISATTDSAMAVCKALDIATAHRPGPVYLELPDEVATVEEVPATTNQRAVEVLLNGWDDRGTTRLVGNPPTDHSLSALRGRLLDAKRPALIVGGRRNDVSTQTVEDFTEAFRCPVFTSSGQKGLTDSGHSYYAGTFLNGSLETRLLSQADLIVTVNPEAYDVYNKPWPYDACTVAITSGPLDEWLYSFSTRIVADPELTLRTLVKEFTGTSASEWTTDDVRGYRAHVRNSLLEGNGSALSVPAAVDAALSAAPRAARIVADAGFSKPLVAMLSEPTGYGSYLASNALSTMGFSLPAAIAAARASERPVLAFLGDGSLLMRATELIMARSLCAPLVVVAVMDQSLSQIEIKQERLHLEEVGTALPYLSCAKLAEAIGVDGVDVDKPEALAEAVRRGWSAPRPVLIGAHVATEASRRVFEVLRG